MSKTGLTVKIDEHIKKKAKLLAVKYDVSLSQIIEDFLEGLEESEIKERYAK